MRCHSLGRPWITVSGARRSKQAAATYGELARLVVDANVGDVHGIGGRGDGGPARRAQHVAHKGGKGALLLAAVGPALLGHLAIVAVAVARALGAGGRRLHLAGEGVERGRLAQRGRVGARNGVGRVGVLGAGAGSGAGAVRGVQSLLDNGGVEGLSDRGGRQVRNGGRVVYIGGALLVVDGRERGRAAER